MKFEVKFGMKSWQVTGLIAAVVFGFMLSLQLKTYHYFQEQTMLSKERNTALNEVLERAMAEKEQYERELEELNRQVSLRKAEGVQSEREKVLLAERERFAILAGETEVTGKGIRITLDDRKATTIIFSGDVKDIINILRLAGAEGIEFNDQRIIAHTAVHEAGRNLLVNKVPVNRRTGIPYEFKAIGPQDTLIEYLSTTYGLLHDLETAGVAISILKEDVTLAPYAGEQGIKYIEAVD